MQIKIYANGSASNKTKNRLKELGNIWMHIETGYYNNKPAILCEQTDHNYMKWFYLDEISYERITL